MATYLNPTPATATFIPNANSSPTNMPTITETTTSSATATNTSTSTPRPTATATQTLVPSLAPPTFTPLPTLPSGTILPSAMRCTGFNQPSRLNVGMLAQVISDFDSALNSKPARP